MTKILVVEDESIIAASIAFILEAEGYEVCFAWDGQQGVTMAETESPDLIITDHLMPRMDGIAMIRALRDAGLTTPVVLTTAVPEAPLPVEQTVPSAAYDAYLEKPYRGSRLLEVVRILLAEPSGPAVGIAPRN
jgi:CheY-like chemotaxis protein